MSSPIDRAALFSRDAIEWKPIAGHDDYEVSNQGQVRGRSRKHQTRNQYGAFTRHIAGRVKSRDLSAPRARVTLYKNGKGTKRQVSHLVLIAFKGEAPGPIGLGPGFYQANHINGDSLDDRACNLEWLTHSDHVRHTVENQLNPRGERINTAKLSADDVKAIRHLSQEGVSYSRLAHRFSVCKTNIANIINRQTWRHL